MNLSLGQGAPMLAHQTPQRVLVHFNSRTVVMKVDICEGVCKSPNMDASQARDRYSMHVVARGSNEKKGVGSDCEALGVSLSEKSFWRRPMRRSGLVDFLRLECSVAKRNSAMQEGASCSVVLSFRNSCCLAIGFTLWESTLSFEMCDAFPSALKIRSADLFAPLVTPKIESDVQD